MNEPQKIENQEVSEVSSLLIPLRDRHLLVPAVTVAEMVPYRTPEGEDPESPDWYLGDITWRDQRIPLISYEGLCGEAVPRYDGRCRIAVLNNVGVDEGLPFIALATQGIPRLSRVKSDEVHELEDAQTARFDLMHVSHAGETLAIPDVLAVQQAFLDYRNG